jgi:hypothetical protein
MRARDSAWYHQGRSPRSLPRPRGPAAQLASPATSFAGRLGNKLQLCSTGRAIGVGRNAVYVPRKALAVESAHVPLPPQQQPYVPLLIAGGGERVALRQVAEYADMANFGPHQWVCHHVSVSTCQPV